MIHPPFGEGPSPSRRDPHEGTDKPLDPGARL